MSVIPQTPRASGGLNPLGPLPGLCLGPAGDAVPRPLAYSRPPNLKSWIRPCICTLNVSDVHISMTYVYLIDKTHSGTSNILLMYKNATNLKNVFEISEIL